jgi:hypothetical protein
MRDIQKFSIIRSAQTTLGGIKKILNGQRCPNKVVGARRKKSKRPKRFEFTKITDRMMLNQVKKGKKSPSPILRGKIKHFGNKFK